MAPPMASALRKRDGSKKQSVSFASHTDVTNEDSPRHKRARVEHHEEVDEDQDERHYEIESDSKFSLMQENNGGSDYVPIEPFHMRNEREDGTGYFDGDTYVFRRGKRHGEEDDAWLDDLEEQQEQQYGVVRKQQEEAFSDEDDSDRQATQMSDSQKISVCRSLASLLSSKTNETVAQALSRYGAIQKQQNKKIKKQPAWKKQLLSKHDNGEQSKIKRDENEGKEETHLAKANIAQVSEMADALLVSGIHGIYDMSHEDLTNMVQKLSKSLGVNGDGQEKKSYFGDQCKETNSNDVNSSLALAKETDTNITWEYKGNDDGQIHGPFTTEQMISWRSAGFFVGKQAVDIRVVQRQGGGNISSSMPIQTKVKDGAVDDLMADLESDDEENSNKCTSDLAQGDTEWIRSDSINFSSYLH